MKARQNDITFCHRNSHYDEYMTRFPVSNYKNFGIQMIDFAKNAMSKINDPNLEKEFEGILETPITDQDGNDNGDKYKNLLNGRFKLTRYYA